MYKRLDTFDFPHTIRNNNEVTGQKKKKKYKE